MGLHHPEAVVVAAPSSTFDLDLFLHMRALDGGRHAVRDNVLVHVGR